WRNSGQTLPYACAGGPRNMRPPANLRALKCGAVSPMPSLKDWKASVPRASPRTVPVSDQGIQSGNPRDEFRRPLKVHFLQDRRDLAPNGRDRNAVRPRDLRWRLSATQCRRNPRLAARKRKQLPENADKTVGDLAIGLQNNKRMAGGGLPVILERHDNRGRQTILRIRV